MKTQAWGWLVAGVLAAGINASYHDGGLQWAHNLADRVQDRSEAVLALATGHAERFLTAARLVKDHNQTASCRAATVLARAETKLARNETTFAHWQAMSDRQVAQLDRLEANRTRIENQVNAQLAQIRMVEVPRVPVSFRTLSTPVEVHTICTRVRVPQVHVSVPAMPAIRIPSPHVSVDGNNVDVNLDGDGPI